MTNIVTSNRQVNEHALSEIQITFCILRCSGNHDNHSTINLAAIFLETKKRNFSFTNELTVNEKRVQNRFMKINRWIYLGFDTLRGACDGKIV